MTVNSVRLDAQPTSGRIVVKVTTLEGAVEMPGMQVELRQEDGTVIAKTMSDDVGQLSFPDVPPGRYTVAASRPGFVPAVSAAFDVRANEVANVLLDTQLTFQMPTVEVRSRRARPDRQRAAGVDERHAVGLHPRECAARRRRLPEPAAAPARRGSRRRRAAADSRWAAHNRARSR